MLIQFVQKTRSSCSMWIKKIPSGVDVDIVDPSHGVEYFHVPHIVDVVDAVVDVVVDPSNMV